MKRKNKDTACILEALENTKPIPNKKIFNSLSKGYSEAREAYISLLRYADAAKSLLDKLETMVR